MKRLHLFAVLAVVFIGCEADSNSDGGIPWIGECSEKGQAGCRGDQRVVCMMGEGQLQWTVAASCSGGCEGGQCVGGTSCQNTCPQEGLIGCSGNRVVACLQGDGCLNWVGVVDCSLGCDTTRAQCVGSEVCTCDGKVCGDDGCGNSCGTCPGGTYCGQDSACHDNSCSPDCSGRVCGTDGCGGSCGSCNQDERCDNGQCVLPPAGPEIVSVTFRMFAGGQFPAYLAHLYGTTLGGEFAMHFVQDLVIRNPDSTRSYDVVIKAELQGYSTPSTTNLRLGPSETKQMALDVTFDLAALYGISTPVLATATVQVFVAGQSIPSDSESQSVRVVPKNSFIISSTGDLKDPDMFPLVSVFVTPHDSEKEVETLITEAAGHSRFGRMFGYFDCFDSDYQPLPEVFNWSVPTLGCQLMDSAYYLQGWQWKLSVIVKDCVGCDLNASFHIVAQDKYSDWLAGESDTALVSLWNLGTATASVTVPSNGVYYLIACNPTENYLSRDFKVQTARDMDTCAIDQMSAIFNALKARGVVYTGVTAGSFVNGQYIKFPSESLKTNSANCIDGSLVFASALEAIGMYPAIIRAPRHAFVAVRAGPFEGSHWFAIETTWVSTKTAEDAIDVATQEEWPEEWTEDYELVDIYSARQAGFNPVPL